ncbi:MAG: hypothetical protein HMLKMBBP_02072 [Planctomycetes bacterium]|nr:hypothetical protein [Planctomycetota bacterium]
MTAERKPFPAGPLMALHVSGAAGTYVVGKWAASGFPDPLALTLARAIPASALCLALTGTVIPAPRFSLRDWAEVALLGMLLVPMNQSLFLAGLKDTLPSHPALIYALTPAGVLLLSSLLARRMPPAAWAGGVTLALAGVALVLEPWRTDAGSAAIRYGDLLIVAGLLVWIVYTVWAGSLARRHDPRTVTAWTLVLGTAALVPFAWKPLAAVRFADVTPKAWIGVAWLAAVTSTLMMLLWNGMLRRLAPVQVAVCANAQPVATALLAAALASLGWLPGDQRLGPVFWTGAAMVLCGVWITQRRAAAKNPSAPGPAARETVTSTALSAVPPAAPSAPASAPEAAADGPPSPSRP